MNLEGYGEPTSPMAALRPEDHNQLHRILKKHPLIASGDPEDRRSMLNRCGAASLCDWLNIDDPRDRFVSALLRNLEAGGPADGPDLFNQRTSIRVELEALGDESDRI